MLQDTPATAACYIPLHSNNLPVSCPVELGNEKSRKAAAAVAMLGSCALCPTENENEMKMK